MRTYELARKYGLTVQGAVTWAFEFEDQPAFASLRALATDGIDKPVLNAFRMMGKLSGNWIETESDGAMPLDQVVTQSVTGTPDVSAAATQNGNEIDVLVWNYHDSDVVVPDAQVRVEVDELRDARLTESEFRMDAEHSNAYRVWQQIGSPAQPNADQLKELQKAGQLEETVSGRSAEVTGGKAHFELAIPPQGVVLIRLQE
jgi:xylan 1,4-beta-xylosidase